LILAIVALLFVALLLRVGFIGMNLRDIDSLWYDFEHRGFKFQLARCIDWLTLLGFSIPSILALYWFADQSFYVLLFFTCFLGMGLLVKLPVHKFPRLNVPGAMNDAKASLIAHLVAALLGSAVLSLFTMLILWLRS
jgi:hypothetical protein